MSRRLPIYFLVDVSESMMGNELSSMQNAVEKVVKDLRSNPYALETVWISVIVFAGRAKTLNPLQGLMNFIVPDLPCGGGTSLGVGLAHLMKQIDADFQKTTSTSKGDWKPVVFLLTDGHPSDNPDAVIKQWTEQYSKKANLVAVSIGSQADLQTLNKLTSDVVEFDDERPDSFSKFAQWVTASISAESQRLEQMNTNGSFEIESSYGDVIREASLGQIHDERYLVVVGKCSTTQRPYLFKYQKQGTGSKEQYQLLGEPYRLEESYWDLSESTPLSKSISSNLLDRAASCPFCSNYSALSVCECNGVTCIGDPGEYTCPWCAVGGDWQPAEEIQVRPGIG